MASDVKQYTTFVSIDGYNKLLRPGMSAQVEILVTELPETTLSVPVQAILQTGGKEYVYVMTAEGGAARREVELGVNNEKHVEIKKGLKAGEDVALNWTVLLSEEEKNVLFKSSKGDGKNKTAEWGAIKGGPTDALDPTKKAGDPAKGQGGAPGKAKAKGQGGRPKMFPDDPALQAKVDKIPRESMKTMFTGSAEEKAEILQKAGLTDDEIKKYEDARAAVMERMKAGGFGGGGGGGFGGPGGGGGGFGGPGGGGGGGFGGGRGGRGGAGAGGGEDQ
jgi:hypothetical protein